MEDLPNIFLSSSLTIEEIDASLINSDLNDLRSDFVAVAIKIREGEATHAGLIISTNGKYFLFHFIPQGVGLIDVPKSEWYFHKVFDFISSDESAAFLSHCKIIKKESKPTFGYSYDGSYYDSSGTYFSKNNLPQIMTCVGFCMNVVLGYIESKVYFEFESWPSDPSTETYFDEHEKEFIEKFPDHDIEKVKENWRRITPAEYFASGFLQIPIKRIEINKIIENVKKAIKNKQVPTS